MQQTKPREERDRDEPEPAEIERAIELMPGCNQRLAVLRARGRPGSERSPRSSGASIRAIGDPSLTANQAVAVPVAGMASAAKYWALKPAQSESATSLGSPSLSVAFSMTFWFANATASSCPDCRPPLAPLSEMGVSTTPTRSPEPAPDTSRPKRYEFPEKR